MPQWAALALEISPVPGMLVGLMDEANNEQINRADDPVTPAEMAPQDQESPADAQGSSDPSQSAAAEIPQDATPVGQDTADEQPNPEAAAASEPDDTATTDEPAADAQKADIRDLANAEPAEIAAVVEAILFTTDTPLAAGKIASIAQLGGQKVVKTAVRTLNERYEQVGASFRIEEIGGGYQMLTMPEYHDVLGRLSKVRNDSKLSQAAMETLAVIAYRQPVIRADIEAIRGVASGEVLRGLMERGLAKIVGRAEVIGRPMLYGTTRKFLDVFGLGSLEDLPRVEELRGGKDAKAPAPAAPEQPAAAQAVDSPADAPAPQEPAAETPPATEGSYASEQSAGADEAATQEATDESTPPETSPLAEAD